MLMVSGIPPNREAQRVPGEFRPNRAQRLLTLWDGLLAIGILFSLETQLRWGTSSVGPGELSLATWILVLIPVEIWRFRGVVPRPFWDVWRFWAVFAVAQSIGLMVAIVKPELDDLSFVVHDTMAYSLVAAISALLLISRDPGRRLHRIQWMLVLIGCATLPVQVAQAFGVIHIGSINPWYWTRMAGWCDNPNQLALLCLLLGLLALDLAEKAARPRLRLLALVCMFVAFGVGWLSRSNAYVTGIALSALLFALIKTVRWLAEPERRRRVAAALPGALLVLSGCIVGPLALSRSDLLGDIHRAVIRDPKQENEEVGLRVYLWKEALEKSGESAMLGFGPGPHLAIPEVLLANRRDSDVQTATRNPQQEIAPNYETHNTILELLVQGGIIAAVDFLWLGAIAFWRTWRAGRDALCTTLLGMAYYGTFGVIFRHPLVWFTISLALVARPAVRSCFDRSGSRSVRNLARLKPSLHPVQGVV